MADTTRADDLEIVTDDARGAALRVEAGGERAGLVFERYFTRPDTHPYDELEWELRDAVLKNWRDGTTSFEQRDVEFPTSWSMMATQIVSQKYFRGTLGSPERERSVKHMIDRVADTITGWGIEGGYFADDESAEVFNHELKHLLVNQQAAFNSPVWFNVGVEEKPQCSACQPWDALVSTPEGQVPIGRLVDDDAIGTKVYDAHGVTKVVATKHNGRKQVLRVHLKSGAYLDVTPDHLVWRAADSSGRGEFVEAGELRPGDRLEWHRTYAHGAGEVTTTAIAEAALAGWLQSDGFVGQYDGTNRSLTIEAMTVNDAERAWVLDAIDRVLPGVHRHERTVETQDLTLDCRRIRLYGNGLRDFVERWDLLNRGPGMTVPEHLFTAPLPVVAAYLRSLFQAEGYVQVQERSARIGFDMVSEALVRGAQTLLQRFGIFSRVHFKRDARPDRHGCWSLSIATLGDRAIFRDEIGFVDDRKSGKLEASLELEGKPVAGTKTLQIARIEDRGEMDVYDIQTESGEYLSSNLRVHNCFILSVEDTMSSILNWYVEEGTIFKGGSGAGINLSSIRSSKENLKGGGEASGPVSFMRGADASAGTIKSGGKTRRAAKMVILNVDHPDIEEFIWTKAREEDKIRVLREAGFDMDLDSPDYASIQYQNANNSVRVTDEFMQAYEEGRDYELRAVTTGEVIETRSAADVMRQISEAAWACADPGVQYDTIINDWHTCPESGRINGSNPCFPADALVHTDKGLVRFDELIDRVNAGEAFGVYTHDATSGDEPAECVEVTTPEAFMLTGTNPIVRLTFSNGMQLRCTPNHRVWTTNRGYVEAENLTAEDQVKILNLPAPAVHAEWRLPVSSEVDHYRQKGDRAALIRLPEKWDEDFAHYLGWLVGDGSVSGDVVSTIYGSEEDREHVLPRHRELVAWMNGDREPTPSVQANGTVQLRQSRRAVRRFLEALGVTDAKAAAKRVPASVRQAPSEIVAAFLTGLFDADGCVSDTDKARYVGLGSRSIDLLRDVQVLLTTFGIHARIYEINHGTTATFHYTKVDGTDVSYEGSNVGYDLRISGRSVERFAESVGFSLPAKQHALTQVLTNHVRYKTDETARLVERIDDGFEQTYNLSEPRNHSYVVGGVVVRNCSEYMHLDNSACNLASLNLKKFYDYDAGRFDVEAFKRAVEVVFTAQEIIVGFSSYPTESIGENAIDYRELGLGYANLGGLLMSIGLPYDSDEGRAWCGAITALMTGHAYKTSAEIAKVSGPFNGYKKNEKPMLRVIGKHRDAVESIDPRPVQPDLLAAARQAWDEALEVGTEHGFRNSQASVLAPTGCLVGGSLVTTDRGLVRLRSLGDPAGAQWQEASFRVDTDEGPRDASHFYVNGAEAVVTVDTSRGYRIQGTPTHRIKVVAEDGSWHWRRFGDIAPGDRVPLKLGSLVGDPNRVTLPPLGEAYWTGEHHATAPREVTPELAEFVGYFMGDGSLHARGLRLCVADEDRDVVERLKILGKELFNLEAHVSAQAGYTEVAFHSVRIVEWWGAVGFAKHVPQEGHQGKGWEPYVPDAILHTNDRAVYAAFVRGLFEADGTVTVGYPNWSTTSLAFSHEVQTLLLALGYPTTRRMGRTGWGDSDLAVLRVLNSGYHEAWLDEVGFLGGRKNAAVEVKASQQSARHDHVPVPVEVIEELAPAGTTLRSNLLQGARRGRTSRTLVTELFELTGDARLEHLLGFFYDEVATAELGEDELTYDLSVPDNVTYVANGFVSHNTIGLMMDCDTTGIEPDLGLVKMKKLVGGGSITIVNQTVPQALDQLGYTQEQVEAIVAYIDENKTIHGAPALRDEHKRVFQCAMGDDSIHYMGHVRMMAAAQPFISGAISKTVNMPEEATVEDVEQLHLDAWKLGIKAIAIYRDNCKVAQPLSVSKKEAKAEPEAVTSPVPMRRKLPKTRPSQTISFRVGDAKGYITAGEYPGDGLGEIFVKLGKQGSTLSGLLDAFAISVSIGLQYGVPLESYVSKFMNMRFEPAGMTDDEEIRFATSLVDFLARKLALEYLPHDQRESLGIFSLEERTAMLDEGYGEETVPSAPSAEDVAKSSDLTEIASPALPIDHDAPMCFDCGIKMQRAGACYVCNACGTTSGCS